MAAMLRPHLLIVAILSLSLGVLSQSCSSYGVDYSNGGSYYIDGSSNQYFSFISVFQGCGQETINPVLVDPDNNQYACSAIQTGQSGNQVTSTCGIPFSAMKSGTWRIIVSGGQIAVQRTIALSVGIPQTTTVTATPTIVIGVTSTPRAITVVSTIVQTQTLILVPATVTANCGNAGPTQTVTVYPQGPTVTVVSTVTRTSTIGARTSAWTTTLTTSAACHYPTKKRDLKERNVYATAAVAAVTVTVTQTTFTVTRSIVTTLPPATTTEAIFRIATQTITPVASTVCVGGNRPGVTVTVQRGNPSAVTQTNISYRTVTTSGTVWLGQTMYSTITNSVSATACWRAGGWYGL